MSHLKQGDKPEERKIEKELEYLKMILEAEGKKVIAENCKVFRLFVRRDGFKDSDTLEYDKLTKEQFSILVRREWKIPIKKRLNLMADEPYPPYMDNNIIIFYPIKWKWNKKTLEIMYEEK